MTSSHYLPDSLKNHVRAMVFVDGENLAIRYKELLGQKATEDHVKYNRDIYVWSNFANIYNHVNCEVIRRYYYTVVQGDESKKEDIELELKNIGIETPRVFKKAKGRSSKRVDITLATDMLAQAHRDNYDIAILVAGDEDYVPLVKAIKDEGKRVVLWFFEESKGLSNHLKMEADYFFDISWFLLKSKSDLHRYY